MLPLQAYARSNTYDGDPFSEGAIGSFTYNNVVYNAYKLNVDSDIDDITFADWALSYEVPEIGGQPGRTITINRNDASIEKHKIVFDNVFPSLTDAQLSAISDKDDCIGGFWVGMKRGKVNAIYGFVIIEWPQSDSQKVPLTDEEKKPLSELLASVLGENEADWYQENDRYNGNPTDTLTRWDDSFWKSFVASTGPRSKAQKVLETAETVDEINVAVEELEKEIDKLIPITEVNATKLYEFLQQETQKKESDYTEASWALNRPLIEKAQAELDSLFDSDGNPTEKNKAERQAEVDSLTDIPDAYTLVNKNYYAPLYENHLDRREEALGLLQQYDPSRLNQSEYTAASWEVYAAAYDALKADMAWQFSGGTYADYQMLLAFDNQQGDPNHLCHIDDLIAARLQLASSSDVTFAFTYVNNLISRYPDFPKDGTAIYNGQLTLTTGNQDSGRSDCLHR